MNSKGFAQIIIIPVVLVVLVVGGYFFLQNSNDQTSLNNIQERQKKAREGEEVAWQYRGETGWFFIGDPPDCPKPLEFPAPVDVGLASGILYPGQIRGNDYKPHGGFRFDNLDSNDVEVRAIMDGYITKAAKYDDGYDVQIQIFYINDCGIMVMNDHMLTPSPRLEEVLADIPVGKDGDSRTTFINPPVFIEKGDLIATEVGYPNFPGGHNDKNIFVDFGLYDLRETNGVNYDEEFRAKYPNINEYGTHALCWLDYLEEPAKTIIKNLPAEGSERKESEYCNSANL